MLSISFKVIENIYQKDFQRNKLRFSMFYFSSLILLDNLYEKSISFLNRLIVNNTDVTLNFILRQN